MTTPTGAFVSVLSGDYKAIKVIDGIKDFHEAHLKWHHAKPEFRLTSDLSPDATKEKFAKIFTEYGLKNFSIIVEVEA